MSHILPDNGGRRIGIERRQFSYTMHISKWRSGNEKEVGLIQD
jgi:hypothetical protein